MGRRSASLLKGRASAQERFDALLVNAHAAPRQDDQPSAWTILLSVSSGYLRWRSLRPVPDGRPEANGSTTAQVLLASTRLGDAPVLYKDRYLRNDEAPVPLTPDQIEAQEDLDFYLECQRREREQAAAFDREWTPRLRKLGLVQCRLPGLPTTDGKPCTCRTCRPIT